MIQVSKLKGFRWNFHSKVTAFSVETQWKVRNPIVGVSLKTEWRANLPVAIGAEVLFNNYETLGIEIGTIYGQRTRAKAKQKSKRWCVREFAGLDALFRFKEYRHWYVKAPVSWISGGYAGALSRGRYDIHEKVVKTAEVSFNAFENDAARVAGWSVRKSVGNHIKVRYDVHEPAGSSACAIWDVEKLGVRISPSWKSDLKLVVSRSTKSDTRITVGKSISASWSQRVKVYSIKSIRYKVFETFVFVAPHQPLPRSGKKKAVIPNITYKKLSVREKLKVK